ncbi:hypothetical protein [Arenimonas sp.]|uniref:hypothetical protein n=1 Tax=Arenimonas sp. TaxID=1872635 RepID=UPI0035B4A87C
MRRSPWAWLAVLTVLVLIAAAFWLRTSDEQGRAPAGTEASPAPATAKAPIRPDAPMPPADLPAAAQAILPVEARDMLALAEAGGVRAACRLGSLLASCGSLAPQFYSEETEAELRVMELSAAGEGDLQRANQLARAMLVVRTRRQHCHDLPGELLARAGGYLRQAALAGDREALVRYIRGDAFVGIGFSQAQTLHNPHFDQWRREALTMLHAGFEQGRPEAVLLLLEAHSDVGGPLALITPVDPLLDRAYLQLASLVFRDFALPDDFRPLHPDETLDRQARALALRWHREHFGGRQFSVGDATLGFGSAIRDLENRRWVGAGGWRPACTEAEETRQ